jgi:hypothetical protein
MKKLHDKIRVIAQGKLDTMIDEASGAIDKIIDGTALTRQAMARLVQGHRTDTAYKAAVKKLADVVIGDLIEEFNSQQELPLAKKETL